jgi:tetratricopeptide (TPR) repeat protein
MKPSLSKLAGRYSPAFSAAAHTSRLGETEQAERLYRSILGSYPDDVEAWLQLGELLFHRKSIYGGDIQESNEAWNRVLQLEPDQPIAFVHQARLAAAAGDREALYSASAEALRLIPEGDRTLEMELLRALVQDDPVVTERALDLLRGGSDDALSEVAWSTTTFLLDPEAAEPVLRIMTEPTRSFEMQVLGNTMLAYQSLARGRRIDALAALDRIESRSPITALEHRANILLMPFAPADSVTLEFLREDLLAMDPSTVVESPAPGIWVAVHNGAHHPIRGYLLGLVDANLGRTVEAFHEAGELANAPDPPGFGSAFVDWSNGIRASSAQADGRTDDALAEAENLELTGWYVTMTPSPMLGRSRERWLLATLLEEAGRIDEALRWYGSFEDFSPYSRAYEAPSHWRRARIYERRGELGRAREHYERFLELWENADVEFRPMVDEAREWVEGFVEER